MPTSEELLRQEEELRAQQIQPSRLRGFLAGLGQAIAGRPENSFQTAQAVVQEPYEQKQSKLKQLREQRIDTSEREAAEAAKKTKAQNDADEAEAAKVFIKSLRDRYPGSISLTDEQIDVMGPSALTKLAPRVGEIIKAQQESNKAGREISKQAEVERHNRAMEAIGAERAKQAGADKDAAITERADAKALSQLSTRIEKSGINQLEDRLDEIDHEFSLLPQTKPDKEGKTKPKDIPGYGRLASTIPTWATAGQTRKIRGLVSGLSNIQLNKRSGVAVTLQELNRFKEELGSGKFESEDALIQGLQRLRSAMARDRQTIQAGYKPNVVKQYKEQYDSYDPEALTGPAPAAGASGLTPEQRQESTDRTVTTSSGFKLKVKPKVP